MLLFSTELMYEWTLLQIVSHETLKLPSICVPPTSLIKRMFVSHVQTTSLSCFSTTDVIGIANICNFFLEFGFPTGP